MPCCTCLFNKSYVSLVADPEFDGLRLVFYSEDIGELGRMHVKIGKMDGFTTSALSNASTYDISLKTRPNQWCIYL